MAIVTEISWDDMLDGKPLTEAPAHKAWRNAVSEIAEKAKARLPECNGRVDKAVAIILAGGVELLADGTARVASQSSSSMAYHVVKGRCDCRDFERAPGQLCKHRLAFGLARRAQELVSAKPNAASNGQAAAAPDPTPTQPDAPMTTLPEAPVSITLKATLHGHEVLVTLRGVDFASVKAQVEQASEWLSVQGTGQTSHQEDYHYCPLHKVPLKQQHKDGRTWYSHWVADEKRWCKGKVAATG
jgi:hypothetical protein